MWSLSLELDKLTWDQNWWFYIPLIAVGFFPKDFCLMFIFQYVIVFFLWQRIIKTEFQSQVVEKGNHAHCTFDTQYLWISDNLFPCVRASDISSTRKDGNQNAFVNIILTYSGNARHWPAEIVCFIRCDVNVWFNIADTCVACAAIFERTLELELKCFHLFDNLIIACRYVLG